MSSNHGSNSKPVVKGALSSISSSHEEGRKRSEVHITWDEQTIAEHDKLRGTRQKIDEPSTPYHYGSGESSQGSDCESTDGKAPPSSAGSSAPGSPHIRTGRNRRGSILKVMADVSAALPSESALRRERQARWDSDVSDGSMHEDKEKARQFKQHREAHYNEFRALQEWRDKRASNMTDESDESDEDEHAALTDKNHGRPQGDEAMSSTVESELEGVDLQGTSAGDNASDKKITNFNVEMDDAQR